MCELIPTSNETSLIRSSRSHEPIGDGIIWLEIIDQPIEFFHLDYVNIDDF